MQRIWKILPLAVALASCATSEVIKPDEYDATKHARLRVFSEGSNAAAFFIGVDCDKNKRGTRIVADGLNVFLGIAEKQNRIGMTQTVATDVAQAKSGIFKEYVIPAGQFVNIIPSHTVSRTVCRVAGKPCEIQTKELCEYGPANNMFSKGVEAIGTILMRTVTLGAYDGHIKQDNRRSFIPEAGKQYEYIPTGCAVAIDDITEENIVPVKLSPIYQCE